MQFSDCDAIGQLSRNHIAIRLLAVIDYEQFSRSVRLRKKALNRPLSEMWAITSDHGASDKTVRQHHAFDVQSFLIAEEMTPSSKKQLATGCYESIQA